MAIRIPENKKWSGMFPGNYFGNLWQTFNIDLERQPGRIVLSDKLKIYKDISALGLISKILRTNANNTDMWWGLVLPTTTSATDGDLLNNGSTGIIGVSWVTDATAGGGDASPNNVHDFLIHESANGGQRLLCSTATNLAILNKSGGANVWDIDWGSTTAGGIALQNTCYHWMGKVGGTVAIADLVTIGTATEIPVIHTVDRNDVFLPNRLILPTGYVIRTIVGSLTDFWIGLEHMKDGNAKVIRWNLGSLGYDEWDLIGSAPMTGFIVKGIPYFITEKGYIFKYNGLGFDKVQDFNFQEQRMILTSTQGFSTPLAREDMIKPYGYFVDENIVYLNVGVPMVLTPASATTLMQGVRRARSGIWIFNTKTNNLYHHMAFGEHASAGTDLSYGCAHVKEPGTVIKARVGSDQILIATATVFNGGGTWIAGTTKGLYRMIQNNDQASNAGRNRGYFITPYIPIADIDAMWEALWIKFKKFVNSNNRIVVKWRVVDPLFNASAQDPDTNKLELLNCQGTWASTTTFTAAVPTGVAVGDEVEILSGDNAGCSFAITTLSATPDSATSITVTIAEATPTSSTDKFLCRFDNWTTETAISSTSVDNQRVPFTGSTRSNHGQFLQLKIELRGFDVSVDELQPIFKTLTSPQQG